MGEYQYWEFQALDRRLNDAELKYVDGLSSRVELSPSRAAFEYHYSSLRADETALLTKCFDAMFYIANWGTRRLMFRLPLASVDRAALERYACGEDEAYCKITFTPDYAIVDIYIHDDDLMGWIDSGAGELDRMVGLREDLLRGDYRMLYLTWLMIAAWETGVYYEDRFWNLAANQNNETDAMPHRMFGGNAQRLLVCEPPVPSGLSTLTPALDHFIGRVLANDDRDLIAAAAVASENTRTIFTLLRNAKKIARQRESGT